MPFKLYFPIKPISVSQHFGGNPAYYARFHDRFGNPEKGHMGTDLVASHGQPVYAACDGMAVYSKDEHGGEGITIQSEPSTYHGQPARFLVICWHLCGDTDPKFKSPIPLDGNRYPVKAGDLIGHADNTGAPFESNGTHLHFGVTPTDLQLNALYPGNGFNGCIDAEPFFNGFFAGDAPKVISIYGTIVDKLKSIISILKT
jgi:murein DD-endopeptidase MepM/ murein hydrolase activator NlpD